MAHCERKHWGIIVVEEVLHGEKVLGSACSMRSKRNILMNDNAKWKVRLNIHGGHQEFGVNYCDTSHSHTV